MEGAGARKPSLILVSPPHLRLECARVTGVTHWG